jgi:hypothetical protein
MVRTMIVDAELRSSPQLGILLAAAHVVAAACPWLAGLPPWSSIAISALVLGWGVRQVGVVAGLRGRDAVTRFRLHADGRMVLMRRAVEASHGNCVGIETLGRLGVLVQCRESDGGLTRVIVWRDQCEARTLRRLRIASRWNAGIAPGHESRTSFGESRDLA